MMEENQHKPKIVWGRKGWYKRWLKERRRVPTIGMLSPGVIIRRKWHHHIYVVKVCDGFYLWRKKEYPTLYSIVVAIAGKLYPHRKENPGEVKLNSNFSAETFFGLR